MDALLPRSQAHWKAAPRMQWGVIWFRDVVYIYIYIYNIYIYIYNIYIYIYIYIRQIYIYIYIFIYSRELQGLGVHFKSLGNTRADEE